jgi:hypothetical protein
MLFHQSQNPVSAAPSDTMKPAMMTYVAATNASRAAPGCDPFGDERDDVEHGGQQVGRDREVRQRRVRRLPHPPPDPQNFLPLNVMAGFTENSRPCSSSASSVAVSIRYHTMALVI